MTIVSVIVPCYNEQSTIRLLLRAIYQQSYSRSDMEVIIADGMSTDQTRKEVADFQSAYPDLKVTIVDNPKRIIPAALNCAIEAAQGEYIVRLDAHSVPARDYIERCITDLEDGLGENVGGIWEIRPGTRSWIAKSISLAACHPVGVGDARYRYTTQSGLVDTVPFGAFRRDLVNQIGQFDETLLTNEDYEFNTRLRLNGGRVWLNPAIRSTYFARSNLWDLARQYFRYGYWKWCMLRRYPKTLRWRQALPPLFVLSLLGLALLSTWWWFARRLLLIEMLFYVSILLVTASTVAVKERDFRMWIGVPLAIVTMHVCWGIGFLWSLFA